MTGRCDALVLGVFAAALSLASSRPALAADCTTAIDAAAASKLLDRYVTAVNTHDTSTFPELFAASYIQHSGRSPSGLAAQIQTFRNIFAVMPDVKMQVEDRIIGCDKIVSRNTFSATHTQTVRGFAPTGKPFTFRTIDIWRVENGKLAEHWDLTDTVEVLRQLRSE